MTRLRLLWVSIATVPLVVAIALTGNAQTMTFAGTILQVNSPNGSISAGDSFSGSLQIAQLSADPGTNPASYAIEQAGSIFAGPNDERFDPFLFGQSNQVVTIGDDLALVPMPIAGFGDSWGLQGFMPDPGVLAGSPFCFLSFQTPSPGPIVGTAFFVPSDLGNWPPGFPSFGAFFNCVDLSSPGSPVLVGQLTFLMTEEPPPIAEAGPPQNVECTGQDGAFVTLNGSASSPPPPDGTYLWSIDEVPIAEGVQPDVLLGLGISIVTLTVSDEDGRSDTDTVQIDVRDTVAPLVSAEMIQAGGNGHMYDIGATATDVCDPAPSVSATVGADVSDGATITIAKPDAEGVVRFMSSMVGLEVKATDASGNSASATASP